MDPRCFGSRIRFRIRVKSWIRIRITVNILELSSRGGPWKLKMEAWKLKMEAGGSHHPLMRIRIRIEAKSWLRIRIRIEVQS
jgi:hypothetical protein